MKARRDSDPRRFIEGLIAMGCEVVIGLPGDELVFRPRQDPTREKIRDAIRRVARPLPPAVRAEVQRILDSEAHRVLEERLLRSAAPTD